MVKRLRIGSIDLVCLTPQQRVWSYQCDTNSKQIFQICVNDFGPSYLVGLRLWLQISRRISFSTFFPLLCNSWIVSSFFSARMMNTGRFSLVRRLFYLVLLIMSRICFCHSICCCCESQPEIVDLYHIFSSFWLSECQSFVQHMREQMSVQCKNIIYK